MSTVYRGEGNCSSQNINIYLISQSIIVNVKLDASFYTTGMVQLQ